MSLVNRTTRIPCVDLVVCRFRKDEFRSCQVNRRKKGGAKNDSSWDRDQKSVPCGAPKCARQYPRIIKISDFKQLNSSYLSAK